MKNVKIISSFLLAILTTACASSTKSPLSKPEASFFEAISSLCGETFVGTTVYPDDPSHDFANKKLVAEFKECSHSEIRIPFTVGDDTSRTWILTAGSQGLLFKHDHRYPDGNPHDITNYGGFAGNYKGQTGTATKQYFLADKETAQMLPEAKTNVWMLEFNSETQELTYYLERHGKPRYKAVLKLQS